VGEGKAGRRGPVGEERSGPERFLFEREEPNWHAKQAAFNTIYTTYQQQRPAPKRIQNPHSTVVFK